MRHIMFRSKHHPCFVPALLLFSAVYLGFAPEGRATIYKINDYAWALQPIGDNQLLGTITSVTGTIDTDTVNDTNGFPLTVMEITAGGHTYSEYGRCEFPGRLVQEGPWLTWWPFYGQSGCILASAGNMAIYYCITEGNPPAPLLVVHQVWAQMFSGIGAAQAASPGWEPFNPSTPNFPFDNDPSQTHLTADGNWIIATAIPEPTFLTLLFSALPGLAGGFICGGIGRRLDYC
jgi:hypothetical protein